MNEREALKLALEALEAHADIGIKSDKAITAIREALMSFQDGVEQPQDSKKFDPNESFEREEVAKARVREFMRNH